MNLDLIYYDAKSPGAFGSADLLYTEAKRLGLQVSRRQVEKYLHAQPTYTLHARSRRNFPRQKFFSIGIDHVWVLDLADMQSLSRFNDGVHYLLCIIDAFSRYCFVKPLKTKRAEECASALQQIFAETKRVPQMIFSDKGSEFLGAPFQQLMRKHDIYFYTANDPRTKAMLAERLIRSLKNKIYKYMTSTGGKRYVDKLADIVEAYNNKMHSTIKRAPATVTYDTEKEVYDIYFPPEQRKKPVKYKFNVGDRVRILDAVQTFTRGFLPRWSRQLYVVAHRLPRDPPYYRLKFEDTGEDILATFNENELIKVLPDERDENANTVYKASKNMQTNNQTK